MPEASLFKPTLNLGGAGGPGKDITIYGASWCPHCHHEMIELAGTGATFVDCAADANSADCESKGITGYPTLFKNGKSVGSGFKTRSELGI